VIFDIKLLSDNVGGTAELALPELITEDSDFGGCAAAQVHIVWTEESAEKRSSA